MLPYEGIALFAALLSMQGSGSAFYNLSSTDPLNNDFLYQNPTARSQRAYSQQIAHHSIHTPRLLPALTVVTLLNDQLVVQNNFSQTEYHTGKDITQSQI